MYVYINIYVTVRHVHFCCSAKILIVVVVVVVVASPADVLEKKTNRRARIYKVRFYKSVVYEKINGHFSDVY